MRRLLVFAMPVLLLMLPHAGRAADPFEVLTTVDDAEIAGRPIRGDVQELHRQGADQRLHVPAAGLMS